MPHVAQLASLLADLDARGLLRVPDDGSVRDGLREAFGSRFLDASSNDYLGLGRTVSRETDLGPIRGEEPLRGEPTSSRSGALGAPELPEGNSVSRETPPRALQYPLEMGPFSPEPDLLRETELPPGAGSSRLIHGTHPTHVAVEQFVAAWVGLPTALLFASGYAANVGALGALLGPKDLAVSDALNHASLIDGIRLSRAEVAVVPHLDLRAVEQALERPCEGTRWVVVESYYSMDGDGPDLSALRALCDDRGACLYVDEAHSLGVFGPDGAGLCVAAEVVPDALMAAFGKGVGSQGAVVAGSGPLRAWLWNRARSFVFSTAPSPSHVGRLLSQLVRAKGAARERARLREVVERLRGRLLQGGAPLVSGSFGPILGLVLGSEERALQAAGTLRSAGVLTQAIRPPTVPLGESRLRVTAHAGWSDADVDRLAEELLRVVRERSLLSDPGRRV